MNLIKIETIIENKQSKFRINFGFGGDWRGKCVEYLIASILVDFGVERITCGVNSLYKNIYTDKLIVSDNTKVDAIYFDEHRGPRPLFWALLSYFELGGRGELESDSKESFTQGNINVSQWTWLKGLKYLNGIQYYIEGKTEREVGANIIAYFYTLKGDGI